MTHGIHIGDNTHVHDHVIWPVNLSTINAIVNNELKFIVLDVA